MSILNTFFILFKSNAEDVIKGNKAIEKSTKDVEKNLKNSTEEATRLGSAYVKMMENAAGATGALAGLNIIKNSIDSAAQYNAQLVVMGQLTSQNEQKLKAMAIAAQAVGGSKLGALSDFQTRSNVAASMGVPLGPIEQDMDKVREKLRTVPVSQRQKFLEAFGYNDPGNQRLLRPDITSDADYASMRAKWNNLSRLSPEDRQAALSKLEKDTEVEAAADTFGTNAGNTFIDTVINRISDIKTSILNAFSQGDTGAITAAGGLAAGGAIGGWAALKGLGALLGGGAGAGAVGGAAGGGAAAGAGAAVVAEVASVNAMLGMGATGAAGGAAAGVGVLSGAAVGAGALAAGFGASYYGGGWLAKKLDSYLWETRDKPIIPTPSNPAPVSDLDFWRGQGYTDAQASGIMANIQQESSGNPLARGDGGKAHGLAQWHPARRRAIMAGTGIDVSTAPYQKQLEAMAWEMKNGDVGFSDEKFRSMNDPAQAAEYFSRNFERPKNKDLEALTRGRLAVSMASGFPGFSGNGGSQNPVNIEKIEVVTQATDADGIASAIGNALYERLGVVQANADDGVKM